MRDEQYLTVGANPIIPALTHQTITSQAKTRDNVDDVMARLDRVRDGKHLSLAQRTAAQETGDSLSFLDLIDVVNPLQHIPVVSTVYRAVTGDEISSAARLAGDSLYMGPIGAVGSLVDLGIETITGKSAGEHLAALFEDETGQRLADATNPGEAPEAPIDPGPASGVSGGPANDFAPLANDFASLDSVSLSPTEAFPFASADENAATGGAQAPVALESLPADILAALYSSQPVGREPAAAPFDTHTLSPADVTDGHQRWNLLSSDTGQASESIEQPLISAAMVARAYDGRSTTSSNEPGAIGLQGGWFSALAPDAVARYEQSATLKRQQLSPLTDVRN